MSNTETPEEIFTASTRDLQSASCKLQSLVDACGSKSLDLFTPDVAEDLFHITSTIISSDARRRVILAAGFMTELSIPIPFDLNDADFWAYIIAHRYDGSMDAAEFWLEDVHEIDYSIISPQAIKDVIGEISQRNEDLCAIVSEDYQLDSFLEDGLAERVKIGSELVKWLGFLVAGLILAK